MRFISRILVDSNSKCVQTVDQIQLRASRDLPAPALDILNHIEQSLLLIKATSSSDYKKLIASLKRIYVIHDLRVKFEFLPDHEHLAVCDPYFMKTDSTDDSEWMLGISACILVRIAYLGDLKGNKKLYDKVQHMSVIRNAKNQETLFAKKLGKGWFSFYQDGEDSMLPLIFPVEKHAKDVAMYLDGE